MSDGHAEQIFQAFAARADFFARLVARDFPQVGMREAMRADALAGGEPFADLCSVHQSFSGVTFGDVPIILSAEFSGHDELDGAEVLLLQDGQGIRDHVGVTIVKGHAEPAGPLRQFRRQIVQRGGH